MGIIRDMQRAHATQASDRLRANTAAAAQRDLIRSNADLAIAAQQAANDAERQCERRRLYVEARTADAAADNADLRARLSDLDSLLLSTLDVDDHIDAPGGWPPTPGRSSAAGSWCTRSGAPRSAQRAPTRWPGR